MTMLPRNVLPPPPRDSWDDHDRWMAAESRCATLEAALREIATLVPFRDGSDRGRDGLPTGAGTSPGRDLSSTPGRGLPRDDS